MAGRASAPHPACPCRGLHGWHRVVAVDRGGNRRERSSNDNHQPHHTPANHEHHSHHDLRADCDQNQDWTRAHPCRARRAVALIGAGVPQAGLAATSAGPAATSPSSGRRGRRPDARGAARKNERIAGGSSATRHSLCSSGRRSPGASWGRCSTEHDHDGGTQLLVHAAPLWGAPPVEFSGRWMRTRALPSARVMISCLRAISTV